MLRRLPFVVEPVPDEPLIPWLETMAHAYRASFGQMLTAVGLIGSEAAPGDQVYRGGLTATWAACLQEDQAERIASATGLPRERIARMTRTVWGAPVTLLTSAKKVAGCSPTAGATGRFCPACLRETGGRWRMHWSFHFGFACLTHDRLLVDYCPVCGLDPRRTAHSLRLVPEPGSCHNPWTQDPSQRCGGDFTVCGDDSIDGAFSRAQRGVLELVSTDRGDTGIYREDPQPAATVMKDARLLARLSLAALAAGEVADLSAVGAGTLARARAQLVEDPRARTALVSGVGWALALDALGDPERVANLMQSRLATSTSYALHSPQMQELIAAAFRRTRRPAALLEPGASRLSPAERAARLPAMMWPEWAKVLAPQQAPTEVAAVALSAAIILSGTRITHTAALGFLDPTVKTSHMTAALRHLSKPRSLSAVRSLSASLDEASPVDYVRRRSLDYSELLSEDQWLGVAEGLGVSPGRGRRLQFARVHLYREISGNRTSTAPVEYRLQTPADRTNFKAFEASMPTGVGEALTGLGVEFLHRHGINEPVTWSPPLPPETTMMRTTSSGTAPKRWPVVRPAAWVMMNGLTPAEAISEYARGRSLGDIAGETGVARQTVGRVLRRAGAEIRLAHAPRRIVMSDEWLREQYDVQLRTISDIAREIGAGKTTVARRLRGAGVKIRERGGGSHAQALHS